MSASGLGVTLFFKVTIDGFSLGDWTKCEGLSFEYEVEDYKEGGENGFVHRLPGRAKFQNLKLTRPVSADTGRVISYLAHVQHRPQRQSGAVEVRDAANQPVATLTLRGLYPVKWTGPTMDRASGNIATETLELAHNGLVVEG